MSGVNTVADGKCRPLSPHFAASVFATGSHIVVDVFIHAFMLSFNGFKSITCPRHPL